MLLSFSVVLVLGALGAAAVLSGLRKPVLYPDGKGSFPAGQVMPAAEPAIVSPDTPATPPAPSRGAGPADTPSAPSARGGSLSAVSTNPAREERHPAASRGTLVFVIDDAGHNTRQLEPFLKLPGPVTIAVLPGLPFTAKAAAMVKAAGKELILHQPMEALGGLDPGPGAIRSDMDDVAIRTVIRDNLRQLNGARGMNNHMGSKTTADTRAMATVLDETASAGLYFLDSLTTGESVVHSVASLMRQSAWERSVFLDNSPDKASILQYIAEGTKVAEKRGYAVMIGHVWSADLAQTLADLYPQLMEQGFSLSTISKIMMDSDDDDGFGD